MRKKGTTLDPQKLGLWEGCNGVWYTAHGRCQECGKTYLEHLPPDLHAAKSQRGTGKPLDKAAQIKKSLIRIDGAVRVVLTRGCNGRVLDYDNLVASFKPLRDEITKKVLGLSDDKESESLKWEYKQRPGQGVLVEIYNDRRTET